MYINFRRILWCEGHKLTTINSVQVQFIKRCASKYSLTAVNVYVYIDNIVVVELTMYTLACPQ